MVSTLKRGEPIPGSRFVRDFCLRCGCPMRVTQEHIEEGRESWCEECAPNTRPYAALTPRQEGVRRRQSDRNV